MYWFEPALGDTSEDFDLHFWKVRLGVAGPGPASVPHDMVLEAVEERSKSDLNPLHTRLEMGSPIACQHHGYSEREPDASLVGDLYRRGPFLVEADVHGGGKPRPALFDQTIGKVPDPDKVRIIG